MSRTIRVAAGVISVFAVLVAVAAGAAPGSSAPEQPSAALVVESASTPRTLPSTWGDAGTCASTEAADTGWLRWEIASASLSLSSARLDQIERIRFSSECPGVAYAMTFDIWADPALVLTVEIDFVGRVDVTLDRDDLNALGLGTVQQGAAMWSGSALVNVAPETRARGTTLLGSFGPGDPTDHGRCDVP